ncbi:MAG: SMI1/KNR4 family protein, partial [Nitrospira sp.]|nr:SMI1/KNR4 family protein [Nitrospira sp.]
MINLDVIIQNIWRDIEVWYRENAPRLLQDLKDGASDQQISEFEAAIGMSLPDDYKTSVRLHNGAVYVHDYEYLSLEGVLSKWSTMTHLS